MDHEQVLHAHKGNSQFKQSFNQQNQQKKKWKALVNSSSNKWVMQHLWMCVRQSFKMTEEHALFTNQKTPDLTNFKHLVRLLHIDIL